MQLSLDNSTLANAQAIELKKLEKQACMDCDGVTENTEEPEYSIVEIAPVQPGTFLSVTSRNFSLSGNSWILQSLGYDDVLSGDVDSEIKSVISETDAISAAMNEAKTEISYAAVPTVNVTNYGGGSTTVCSTGTSSAKVAAAVDRGDYNKTYNSGKTAQQYKTAVVKAFEGVISYLDDLIANYNAKVTAGLASGHQEVKLTTLLQLRNAMKNCDVPINIEDTFGRDVEYGAFYGYAPAQFEITDGTGVHPAVETNSSDYDVIVQGRYFKYVNEDLDRHYNRQMCFTTDSLDSFIDSGYTNKYMLATVMHEFTHSLHIPNECVAYLMGEVIADDLNYPLNWGGFDPDNPNDWGWKGQAYGYGNTLDSDDEVLFFGDWWEHTSQGTVDKTANASEFANYTADPSYNKNDAKNKRFIA